MTHIYADSLFGMERLASPRTEIPGCTRSSSGPGALETVEPSEKERRPKSDNILESRRAHGTKKVKIQKSQIDDEDEDHHHASHQFSDSQKNFRKKAIRRASCPINVGAGNARMAAVIDSSESDHQSSDGNEGVRCIDSTPPHPSPPKPFSRALHFHFLGVSCNMFRRRGGCRFVDRVGHKRCWKSVWPCASGEVGPRLFSSLVAWMRVHLEDPKGCKLSGRA